MSEAERIAELADRVEGLTAADREVDVAIARAVDWQPHGRSFTASAFTASLEAAMTLIPDECVQVDQQSNRMQAWVRLQIMVGGLSPQFIGKAKTPALAMCAAALRARNVLLSSLKGEGNG